MNHVEAALNGYLEAKVKELKGKFLSDDEIREVMKICLPFFPEHVAKQLERQLEIILF